MLEAKFTGEFVVAISSAMWSVGLFVGLFTSKFIGKKECQSYRKDMWSRIDALQDIMTGGSYSFCVRLAPKKKEDE